MLDTGYPMLDVGCLILTVILSASADQPWLIKIFAVVDTAITYKTKLIQNPP
jgi:hypothetical protein